MSTSDRVNIPDEIAHICEQAVRRGALDKPHPLPVNRVDTWIYRDRRRPIKTLYPSHVGPQLFVDWPAVAQGFALPSDLDLSMRGEHRLKIWIHRLEHWLSERGLKSLKIPLVRSAATMWIHVLIDDQAHRVVRCWLSADKSPKPIGYKEIGKLTEGEIRDFIIERVAPKETREMLSVKKPKGDGLENQGIASEEPIFDAVAARKRTVEAKQVIAEKKKELADTAREWARTQQMLTAQCDEFLKAATKGLHCLNITPPIYLPEALIEMGFELQEHGIVPVQTSARPQESDHWKAALIKLNDLIEKSYPEVSHHYISFEEYSASQLDVLYRLRRRGNLPIDSADIGDDYWLEVISDAAHIEYRKPMEEIAFHVTKVVIADKACEEAEAKKDSRPRHQGTYIYSKQDRLENELIPWSNGGTLLVSWANPTRSDEEEMNYAQELNWLSGRDGQFFLKDLRDAIKNRTDAGQESFKVRFKRPGRKARADDVYPEAHLLLGTHDVPVRLELIKTILTNWKFGAELKAMRLETVLEISW